MRFQILFFAFCLSLFTQVSVAQTEGNSSLDTVFRVPANKAYVIPFTSKGFPGVSVPVGYPEDKGLVSHWVNKDKSVVWYLYQTAGTYDFSIVNKVRKGRDLKFSLSVTKTDPSKDFSPLKKQLTLLDKGTWESTKVSRINIPYPGYYRYELTPITAPNKAIKIKSLNFKPLQKGSLVQHTNYQSSPSVHLRFSSTAPTSKTYNWIYSEILVPKGGDPLATYYMSLGFTRGYMGIQTNSKTERRVLFSVWDSKDAENDDSFTKSDYVTLVDKSERTVTNHFGGEGTGGQSYVPTADWKTGKPVQFLMNVLRDSTTNSMIYSAWYKVDQSPWQYVASWRAPKEQRYFDGFYSFIENYGYTNGWMRREAYYYNAWGKEANTGKWISFNKVGFSHTDGAKGQRIDYEQGVSPDFPNRFYMASGGYGSTKLTESSIPLQTEIPIDNLKLFKKRVQQALKAEAKRLKSDKKSN